MCPYHVPYRECVFSITLIFLMYFLFFLTLDVSNRNVIKRQEIYDFFISFHPQIKDHDYSRFCDNDQPRCISL